MSDSSITRLPSQRIRYGDSQFSLIEQSPSMQVRGSDIPRLALTDLNVKLMSERWPQLMNDQEAFIQLASSVDPLTAVNQTSLMNSQHTLMMLADGWDEMSPEQQRSDWAKLSEQQQKAFVDAGVTPPEEEGSNWFGNAMDKAAGITGTLLGGVGTAIGVMPGGSQAISALSMIGNAPFAVYRGVRQLDSWQQALAAGGAVAAIGIGAAFSPFTGGSSLALSAGGLGTLATLGLYGTAGTFGAAATATATSALGGENYISALQDSWDGERAFYQSAQNEALKILGSVQLHEIAKDVAYDFDGYDDEPFELPAGTFELAQEFAGVRESTNEDVLLSSLGRVAELYVEKDTPEFDRVVNNLYLLMQEQPFMEAVKVLQEGKISMGRDVARVAGLEPGSDLHQLVSGSVDAVTVFTLDPLIALSPVAKFARFAKYSPYGSYKALRRGAKNKAGTFIPELDNLDWRINLGQNNAKVRKMDEQIVEAINTNNALLMPKNMRPIWTEVRNHLSGKGLLDGNMKPSSRRLTTDDLYDWMRESNEVNHIARGISTVPGLGFVAIKPISNASGWGRLRQNVAEFRDEVITANLDLTKDVNLSRLEEITNTQAKNLELGESGNTLQTPMNSGLVSVDLSETGIKQTIGAKLGRQTGNYLTILPFNTGRTIGTFMNAVSNMAPKKGYIVLDGEQALSDVNNFINAFGMTFNVSPHVREQWVRLIAGQADAGAREVLMHHFFDSVFTASGFKNTVRGKQTYEEFLQKFNQHYSIGSLDEVRINTGNGAVPLRRGALPRQYNSVAMAIPNVREMIVGQRLETLLGRQLGVVNPGKMIDMVQNRIWKPAVVLRIGFIPRAVGEEALAWIARGGTGAVLAENRGRAMARMDIRDELVERVAKQDDIIDVHGEIINKIESGTAIDDLTLAERRILSGWRNPNDVKRLQRIIERRTDPSPVYEAIMGYERWLRKVLSPERYVAESIDGASKVARETRRKRFVDTIDQNHPIVAQLLVGKENSWRRLGTQGLNPFIRQGARDWVVLHADSVMKHTGAGNFSFRQDAIKDPQAEIYMADDGTTQVRQRLRDPHAREQYTPGSTDYEAAVHESVHHVFDDEVVGPLVQNTLRNYLPTEFTAEQLDNFGAVLDSWQTLPLEVQELLLDLYFDRPDRMSVYLDTGKANKYKETDGSYQISRIRQGEKRTSRLAIDTLFSNRLDNNIKRFYATHLHDSYIVDSAIRFNEGVLPDELQAVADNRLTSSNYQERFFRTAEEGKAQFLNEMESLRVDTTPHFENGKTAQEVFDLSIKTIQKDGQHVANRVPANRRRLYVPQVQDYTTLRNLIENQRSAGVVQPEMMAQNIATELLGTKPPQAVTESLQKYLDTNGRQLLEESIRQIIVNNFAVAPTGYLRRVGFNDARVAEWVGDVLSGRTMDEVLLGRTLNSEISSMQYIDVPTSQLSKQDDRWEQMRVHLHDSSNMQMVTFERPVAEQLQFMRGQTRIDDPAFGVSQEDAMQTLFNDTWDHVMSVTGRNSRVRYVPSPAQQVFIKTNEGYKMIDVNRTFDPQTADQVFVMSDEGKIIPADFNDRRYFEPENTPGGDPMWELVGPALMDKTEDFFGRTRLVRKNVRTVDPLSGKVGDTTQLLNARWSRVIDVPTTGAPDLATGPSFKVPSANLWDRAVQYGFDGLVTPIIDAALREPMSFHYFLQSRLENSKFLSSTLNAKHLAPVIKATKQTDIGSILDQHRTRGTFKNIEVENAVAFYDAVIDDLWELSFAEAGLPPLQYLRTLKPAERKLKTNFDVVSDEMLDSLERIEEWWRHVNVISSQSAIRNIEPFLDTAESKSMFSQYTKNLLPFWYAEENFIKRWLRSAYTQGFFGIDTIRKGQLSYMGLQHAGIIRSDENGDDWVVIPGSGALQSLISKVVPGAGSLPVGLMMQTRTSSLLPGFSEQAGSPALSPFGTMPLAFMSNVFPEMKNWERAIAGEISVDRSIADKFFPPSVKRFWDAMTAGEDNAQFASAMAHAMIMAEARGEGLPPDYTPAQQEEYLDVLREHARIVMLTRAVLGFVSPGAPSPMLTGGDTSTFSWLTGLGVETPKDIFSDTYNDYIELFGYERGTERFLEDNPYADQWDIVNPMALTVSASETISGTSVPSTDRSLQWYDTNQTWAQQNPYAAAWLVPNEEDEEFSRYAHSQLTSMGIRRRFPPEELLEELKFKEASIPYFAKRREFEQRKVAVGNNPLAVDLIDAEEKNWSTYFLAAHPVFNERITSNKGTLRRQNTLQDLRRVVDDPLTPPSSALEPIRVLINAYDQFDALLGQNRLNGRGADNMRARDNLISQWTMFLDSWKLKYPSQIPFYESIIERELEGLTV
jgi:hypothetical protein